MLKKSPEIPKQESEKLSSEEEKKSFKSPKQAEESLAESIKALKRMKDLVEEKARGELEKKLLAEYIGEINDTLRWTTSEVHSGNLNISLAEIAEDVEEKDFRIIKKDKLINPETGKETNINRIEFDLELTYPNREKETLRFVSLEVPEKYHDLMECDLWQQIEKNTQGKDWAPRLKQTLNQKHITWQKHIMRNKDNRIRIWTKIPLEASQEPTDIKRETLKRGMRTMTLEENIVLVKMALRNGISQRDLDNKQKLEEFFGIKDLGGKQDNWDCICDFAFYTQQNGEKSGFLRGGHCGSPYFLDVEASCFSFGYFSLHLNYPALFRHILLGFRLTR